MIKLNSRHSTSKTMIVVAASLALGTAMMATPPLRSRAVEAEDILAVAGILVAVSTAAILPAVISAEALAAILGACTGSAATGSTTARAISGCYVPTPDGYAWACY